MAMAPRSVALSVEKAPWKAPSGVLTALTITISKEILSDNNGSEIISPASFRGGVNAKPRSREKSREKSRKVRLYRWR